jgi:hypothetical protein
MRPRTRHRLRYALRLVASVFLLSSPCSGALAPVTAVTETAADRATFAAAHRSVR